VTDYSWLKWLIAGLLLYVSFMLISLPANLAIRVIEKAHLPITLSNATGSIWNGSASVVMRIPENYTVQPGHIKWRINPFYLPTGRIGIQTEFKANGIRVLADGKAGTETIIFDKLDARLPLTAASLFSPVIASAGLTGTIHAKTSSLSLGKTSILGTAELHLDSLSTPWLGPASGSYKIDVEADGNVVRYVVTTKSAAIQLKGAGSWEPFSTGRLAFDASVSGNSGTPLPPALQNLGKTNRDGSIQLTWNTHLSNFVVSSQRP
jgi:hypothetical protein